MEGGKYEHNKPVEITPETVAKFFEFKMAVKTAKSEEELIRLCEDYGITLSEENRSNPQFFGRENLLHQYLFHHFPQSAQESEQQNKVESNVANLVSYLHSNKSRSILWIGGSYGTGKVKNIFSDIDAFLGLPEIYDDQEIKSEIEIFRGMQQIGFVIADRIAPVEDLASALKTGRGLVRLSGMTIDGVELDFHGVGIRDLKSMDKLWPGYVERVRHTPSYEEERTSFTGEKDILPKPGDKLFNYKRFNSKMFKGFYPDNFSVLAKLVYDPAGDGEKIQGSLWFSVVKSFLFHSGAYIRNQDGKIIGINRNQVHFNKFLRTIYYQNPEDYSDNRLKELEEKYEKVLEEISNRYKIPIA